MHSIARRTTAALLLPLALAAAALLLAVPAAADTKISVASDDALRAEAAARGWSGSGDSASDPIVIAGHTGSAARDEGIFLSNTRLHVRIEAATVTAGGASADGIRLWNVQNVVVTGSTLEGNRYGIHVKDSSGVTLSSNTIKSSATGLYLDGSRGVTVQDNRISVNDRDVHLRSAWSNTFRNNNLSIATGQTGFWFDDTASYRNDLDTSNVVNFLPVRWYVGVNGTAGAPVTLTGVVTELRGITNVAQVMVYDSHNVTLAAPRAKAGLAAGVRIEGSSNVTLTTPAIEGNAQEGVLVKGGAHASVSSGSVRNNGRGFVATDTHAPSLDATLVEGHSGDGVVFSGAPAASIVDARILSNTGAGVSLTRASGATVEGTELAGNGGTGLHVRESASVTLRGNTLSDNGPAGVHLQSSTATLEANVVEDHEQGIRLTASAGSVFRDNNVTKRATATGFHFDDVASYAQDLDPSNVVNGVPMRWYHDVHGEPLSPVRLSGFRVEIPGMTNVAQILVQESSDVILDGVTAANGTLEGILVRASEDVSIVASSARNNTRDGIAIQSTSGATLQTTTLRDNRRDGVSLSETSGFLMENSVAASNAGRGIALSASPGATMRGLSITSNGGIGLHVQSSLAQGAQLENSVFADNRGGGLLSQSGNFSLVRGNTFRDNGPSGIYLSATAAGARIQDNVFAGHDRAIQLAASPGQSFSGNNITLEPSGTGFHFDDEASYDVTIDTSNVVDNVTVRWYNRLVGTAAAPVVVSDARAELRGITNVAQVVVHRSENVTLQGAVGHNGTMDGILVLRSANVTLEAPFVRGNAQDGIDVRLSPDVALLDAISLLNTAHGLHLRDDARARVDNATLAQNTGRGLHAENADLALARGAITRNTGLGLAASGTGAHTLTLENASIDRNRAGGATLTSVNVDRLWGLHVHNNSGTGLAAALVEAFDLQESRIENNTAGGVRVDRGSLERARGNAFRGNAEFGLHLIGQAADGQVADNVFAGHARQVQVTSGAGIVFRGNALTLRSGQTGFHFDDVASYPVDLDTSNTANGASYRWYVGRDGGTIADAHAEVPGMTNVAQVLVHGATDLVLAGMKASNGTSHGLLVHASSGVTLEGGEALLNAGDGVRVTQGSGHAMSGANLSRNGGHGIYLDAAPGVRVENATLWRNTGSGLHAAAGSHALHVADTRAEGNDGDGLHAASSNAATILSNDVVSNGGAGIRLATVLGEARVDANDVRNHSAGIRVSGTEFARFAANTIQLGVGGIGFHFDDATSYNNVIPPTNTVDGVAMRWYTTLTGTESQPITLSGFDVKLEGITNVAQVMLYRSAYVTLTDVEASNGVSRGIYLHRSASIVVHDATARDNAEGVVLDATQSSTLKGLDLGANGVAVRLLDSANNVLTRLDASSSGTAVQLDALSRGNRIDRIQAAYAPLAIIDPTVSGTRGNNLVADAGPDRRTRVGRNVTFEAATTTYRFESERFVEQVWNFGDGKSAQVNNASLFRPVHVYAAEGEYEVTIQLRTADGLVLSDTTMVRVVPPLSHPRSVQPTIGDRNVSLGWLPPATDGGLPILGYRIHRGAESGNGTQIAQIGNLTQHFDTSGIVNGQTYFYAVSAFTAEEDGPLSPWIEAAPGSPPGAPRSLEARAGSGNVTLSWLPPATDGGMPLDGYRVLRGTSEASLQTLADVGSVASYVDDSAQNGVTYWYAVAALNNLGVGPASANVSATPAATPPAPEGLSSLVGDRTVILVWNATPIGLDPPVTGHRIYRGTSPESLEFLAEIGVEHSYRDRSVANHLTYHYAVRAVSRIGEGEASAVVAATPEPVDEVAPLLLSRQPEEGALLSHPRPVIGATFIDNTGIDLSRVVLAIDGRVVGFATGPNGESLSFQPDEGYAPGWHNVTLTLVDPAGNLATYEWSFRVLDRDEREVRVEYVNLTLQGPELALGDSMLVTVLVRNVGVLPADFPVALKQDGAALLEQPLKLAGGEEIELNFTYTPWVAGKFQITIGEAAPQAVTVIDLTKPAPPEDGEGEGEGEDAGEEEGGSFLPGPSPWLVVVAAVAGLALLARRRRP